MEKTLDEIEGVNVVIHGGAAGADSLADQWARYRFNTIEEYTADWEKYGKAAGPTRNRQMLKEGKPDLVIAFLAKDSRGTKDMINVATEAGVPVKVVEI